MLDKDDVPSGVPLPATGEVHEVPIRAFDEQSSCEVADSPSGLLPWLQGLVIHDISVDVVHQYDEKFCCAFGSQEDTPVEPDPDQLGDGVDGDMT